MNADKHGAQFPQFRALLDAATYSDGRKSSMDDDSMAVGIKRVRQGITRRQSRVGVAVLGDNEIIGIFLATF